MSGPIPHLEAKNCQSKTFVLSLIMWVYLIICDEVLFLRTMQYREAIMKSWIPERCVLSQTNKSRIKSFLSPRYTIY